MSTRGKRFIQSVLLVIGKFFGVTLHTPDSVALAVNLAKVNGHQSAYYEAITEFKRVKSLLTKKKSARKLVKVRRRLSK